ncbi:hypothetical protein NsoK4_06900 [Nitrosopumilus sp. K4]|uniref:hypothetical protein n=1 Tax=Nitrosopumilus sp. K4 TaxID=2795383 RepID=UPI001BA66A24|nr:hypothetical protein [Nitrosopumilus sp. K4]QUC64168.1 hypothetical protein NsoK4_06900 [Nitrosopumilus sp. K4]
MNFNCVFPDCSFKQNNIEEKDFVDHLRESHKDQIKEIAEKQDIPIHMAEMITTSNSKVFINSG